VEASYRWTGPPEAATSKTLIDREGRMLSLCAMTTFPDPRPAERRSDRRRRGAAPVDLADGFRLDDRRLGLGRRWEDWCRPAGVSEIAAFHPADEQRR
jgi:hypothetical protein